MIFEILEHDYFQPWHLGDWDLMVPGMINLVGTFFIKASTHELMKYNQVKVMEKCYSVLVLASVYGFCTIGNRQQAGLTLF